MYDLGPTKSFRDSVHGYISVPKCFVEHLIDNDWFQRLRNIDQTGMRILYPNARHDRFSHSLGVFYLGQKAVDSLLSKFRFNSHWQVSGEKDINNFWLKNKILFLIACLLHDIGHTPYSHALEGQILSNSKETVKKYGKSKEITLSQQLKENITNIEREYWMQNYPDESYDSQVEFNIKGAAHEQMGALLIFGEFKNKIIGVFDDIKNFLGEDYKSLQYENDDLCFIARMILGLQYDSWRESRQIRNCFIELLNGENFDVDNLDYIIRDTQMSGISNVSVDIERLLNSLCIITKTRQNNKNNLQEKNIKNMTTTFLHNHAKNEIDIKAQIYGTIVLSPKTKVTIEADSSFLSLKRANNEMATIAYSTGDHAVFDKNTILIDKDGMIGVEERDDFSGRSIKQLNGATAGRSFSVSIENAHVLKKFQFEARQEVALTFLGLCDIKIKGEFKSNGALKMTNIEKLSGDIAQIEILGNAFEESYTTKKVSSSEGYNTFSIGYKKQAINCVANVLEARNYLYLWIYAHHKVIYYANFLIPAIAEHIDKIITDSEFPSWKLNYRNLKLLDDAYVWTSIKYLYENKKAKNKNFSELCKQLFTRKYYNSLYKSLAEFDVLLGSFLGDKVKLFSETLQKNIASNYLFVPGYKNDKNYKVAGFLKNQFIEIINKYANDYIIEKDLKLTTDFEVAKLIYVPADYKMKVLKTQKVYIDMGNETVPLSFIPLIDAQSKKTVQPESKYFYLYYELNSKIDSQMANTIIINALKNYYEEIVIKKNVNKQ